MRTTGPILTIASLLALAAPLSAQQADTAMSLDSLLNVKVSTAARYEQTVMEAPASVSVINAEEIERYGVQTLADALGLIRGFYTSYDFNYTYVGVRGFGRPTDYNSRILLLIDGQAINEPQYGSAPIGTEFPLPMAWVERIEVVRGPGSVLYGTGAMFAVVNVITKTNAEVARVHGVVEAGSLGRRTASALAAHQFGNGATLQLGLNRADIGGNDRFFPEFAGAGSDGIARGMDGDVYENAYLTYRVRDFSVSARFFERTKTIPTAAWNASFNDPDTWTLDQRTAVSMNLRHGLSASAETFVSLSYEDYDYIGSYPYEDDEWRDESDEEWAVAHAGLLWDISSGKRLVTGVDVTRAFHSSYETFAGGVPSYRFDVPFTHVGFYGQMELDIAPKWSSVLGISHDRRTGGIDFTTPRLALLYTPRPSTTLKLLYGKAFRAPSPYELYSDSAEAGMRGTVPLNPEQIRTAEIVADQLVGNVAHVSVSVFHNDVSGLIDFVPRVVEDHDVGAYENVGAAEGYGAEVMLHVTEINGHSGFVALSYSHTRDKLTDELLTNSPELLLKAGWYMHLHHRFGAGLFALRESGRRTLAGDKTNSFTKVDGTLTARLSPMLTVTGTIRNVLDTDYVHPGGAEHLQNTLKQDGRTFVVRLDAFLK